MIKARMRTDASWQDVCIVNVSLHGLGIQSARPPSRGAYVEVRRGPHVIVARIAWAKGHRAGLRSQDPIFVQTLLRDEKPADPPPSAAANGDVERRRVPRPLVQAHDKSRHVGRMMEFVCFGAAACAIAFAAFGAIEEALAQPLEQIRLALN